jgi:hypothetical protein
MAGFLISPLLGYREREKEQKKGGILSLLSNEVGSKLA